MSRLDAAPEIIALADELGVGDVAPVDGILAHCRGRIDGWVDEAGGVATIDALESLVASRLQMAFEEIRSDEDFDRLTDNRRGSGEVVGGRDRLSLLKIGGRLHGKENTVKWKSQPITLVGPFASPDEAEAWMAENGAFKEAD